MLQIQIIQPMFDVVLPVGISFYTFQALGYTMDVYRGDIYAERNIFKYGLFVSFFPQLVAGPIERSKNLLMQINEKHVFEYKRIKNGLIYMLWGFFLKIVIADRAALLVNQIFSSYEQYAGFQIVVAVVLFALQIYCDFSGYSHIAMGAAQVMGFHLMNNFRQPYLAVSIKDFWNRWHISLSTWFRDYLYIPLGGNRHGKYRQNFNLMVTFLASGLWHGANWTFLVWGGIHGLYQVIGNLTKGLRKKIISNLKINTQCSSYIYLQRMLTFCMVDFAWIFFRADNLDMAKNMIIRMFSKFNIGIFFDGSLYNLGLDNRNFNFLMVALFILCLVSCFQEKGEKVLEWFGNQNTYFRWLCYWGILFFVLCSTNLSSQEFVYFQF